MDSCFVLIPQQILGEQNPDALLNKRGEENVKCISIFSEALYYSSKLLFCVTGVPPHIYFVDTGNHKKPKQTTTHKPILPLLEGKNSPLGADIVIVVITAGPKGAKISLMIFKHSLGMQLDQC